MKKTSKLKRAEALLLALMTEREKVKPEVQPDGQSRSSFSRAWSRFWALEKEEIPDAQAAYEDALKEALAAEKAADETAVAVAGGPLVAAAVAMARAWDRPGVPREVTEAAEAVLRRPTDRRATTELARLTASADPSRQRWATVKARRATASFIRLAGAPSDPASWPAGGLRVARILGPNGEDLGYRYVPAE